jgi:hypothetical protein
MSLGGGVVMSARKLGFADTGPPGEKEPAGDASKA